MSSKGYSETDELVHLIAEIIRVIADKILLLL
jgi:hypothetical protein